MMVLSPVWAPPLDLGAIYWASQSFGCLPYNMLTPTQRALGA